MRAPRLPLSRTVSPARSQEASGRTASSGSANVHTFPSAGSAPAGAVTFNVENVDVLPHDFTLTGEGVAEQTTQLSPGDTASLALNLPAGNYTYFCSVEGHKEAGMTGTFVVK